MSISGTNQIMHMRGMQKPNVIDITSRLMDKVDTDKNGDVNKDEFLVSMTKKMESMGDSYRMKNRINNMSDSGINQMIHMRAMQKPDVIDITSRLTDKVDADGDRLVGQDGLLARMTKKMESLGDSYRMKNRINNMSDSGINQMIHMRAMQGPDVIDITSRLMDKVDTDKDGALSVDELSQLAGRGDKISTADSDGDGLVSQDELLASVTEKMESRGNPFVPQNDQQHDIQQINSLITQITESSNAGENIADLFSQLLALLGVSEEDANTILASLQNSQL